MKTPTQKSGVGRQTAQISQVTAKSQSFKTAFATLILLAGLPVVAGLSGCAYTSAAPGSESSGVLSASAKSITFGDVAIGSSATQSLSLTNTGTTPASISQATISGSGFTVVGVNPSGPVPVGHSVTVQVRFTPQSIDTTTGTFSIESDAANSPLHVSLNGKGIHAGLAVSPSSLSFGNALVGQSSTQTVQLKNTEKSSVTLNLATMTGNTFSMSGLSLPATIAAGQSVSFAVQFAPTTTGKAAGSVTFTDSAANSPQTLTFTGTGVTTLASLNATPTPVAFGNVKVGSAAKQVVTLTNAGNVTETITQVSPSGSGYSVTGIAVPLSLPAGNNTSFTVQFAPTATGTATGSVSVSATSSASDPSVSVGLSGTGAQAALSPNPLSVNFGSVLVGSSGTVPVTLTNSGNMSTTVSAATVSGAGFSVSGLSMPLTIGAGQSASFTGKFAPSATGNANGTLSITSDAPGSPTTMALSGSGVQAQIAATPSSVSFVNVATGTSNSQPITISNPGSASLTISQFSISGSGFSTTGLSVPLTIQAGKSSSFNAVFAPAVAGSVSGSISLASNAPNSLYMISLAGNGATATASLTPSNSSVSFGSVNDGTTASQSITLTNTGNSNVTISGVTVAGTGFSTPGVSSGLTLMPNQTATLSISFDPSSPGTVTGTATVASNATNSPLSITLSGTGMSATHSVGLAWASSASSGIVGYNVYRGTVSGTYSKITSSSVAGTSYTDTTVQSGQNITYYYMVTAVDSSGVESSGSNQATATVP